MLPHFKPGDFVIYRKPKYSVHPGQNARSVYPSPNGDLYSYYVDKFWTVISVQSKGDIVVSTRRGKQLTVPASDPALRRARWWERLLFRRRFPSPPLLSQG
jgi:hypothetical protein